MKRFFKTTSVFLLPLLLLWLATESFYRLAPTNYSEKRRNIRKSGQAEILILGNSHAFYGLNPEHFQKKAYNLANVSQGIFIDALLFDRYIDSFPKVKKLVINVEYTSLSQDEDTSEEKWRQYFYNTQMGLDVPTIKWYDPRRYSLSLALRFRTTMGFVEQHLDGGLVHCNDDGWANDYLYENRAHDLDGLARYTMAKHEDGSMDFDANTSKLRHVIENCRSRNIDVVLVTMPVSRSYSQLADPKKLNRIIGICRELESAYANCRYLYLFDDARFRDADFFDPDHLNDKGAKKCSDIAYAFLKSF